MEVTVNLIDWAWVKTAPTTKHLLEVMMEQDDADLKFMDWSPELEKKWNANSHEYLRISDSFSNVLLKYAEQSQILKQGLWPLFCWNEGSDDIGVREFPDECYIASFSPVSISTMHSACIKLELPLYAPLFVQQAAPGVPQTITESEVETYLNQWINVIKEAASAQTCGLLIHMG